MYRKEYKKREKPLSDYIAAIKQVVGEDAEIVEARSGHMNTVFLVNSTYVFRFPKNQKVLEEQIFERDVCLYLAKHAADLPFGIPGPLRVLPDPHCFVYAYIAGHNLTEEQLLALSREQKEVFVDDILEFINWLGETLTPETFRQIAAKSNGKRMEPWEEYIHRTITRFDDKRYESARDVCKKLTNELQAYYPNGIEAVGNRVIHDDLHMGNLLFNEHGELSGVIDFGDITIGDLEAEFRHFYRTDTNLARLAVEKYQERYNAKVDFDKVAFWARISEAATLTDKIMTGKTDYPSYIRAKRNLAKWYPDKNWDF